jgi:hypothetical protein
MTSALDFPGRHILEQTPGILRSLLTRASKEDLDWRPSESRWSISMVLAHLADVEVNGFMSRFRDIVSEENPFLSAYNQLALFAGERRFDAMAELSAFEHIRRESLAWLQSVPASAGTRTGRHEELGTISFNDLLNEFAFHDMGHIRQILELYRSHAFYPRMGTFQNYYTINP